MERIRVITKVSDLYDKTTAKTKMGFAFGET